MVGITTQQGMNGYLFSDHSTQHTAHEERGGEALDNAEGEESLSGLMRRFGFYDLKEEEEGGGGSN